MSNTKAMIERWLQSEYEARLQRAVVNAVFSVYIEIPLEYRIEGLCGYNPQRLLAPPDKRRTFRERLEAWREGGDLEAHGLVDVYRQTYPKIAEAASTLFAGINITDEVIDFESRYRDYQVLIVGRDGEVVDEQTKQEEIKHKLAPFVSPTGRLFHDYQPRYKAINDMEAVVPRWGESGADPLSDIKEVYERMQGRDWPSAHGKTDASHPSVRFFLHSDFSEIEVRTLMAMLHHESADSIILDLEPRGGMIPGMNGVFEAMIERAKERAVASRKAHVPDYHRHDPTKNHRRRPRRG